MQHAGPQAPDGLADAALPDGGSDALPTALAAVVRPALVPLVAALLPLLAAAALPDWRAAPGSDEVEIAVDSVDMRGARVAALVRAPLRAIRLAAGAGAKAASRAVLLADFDCAARTVQPLAVVLDGRGDAVLPSSGAPGTPVPLAWGDPLLAASDALCDLARERR